MPDPSPICDLCHSLWQRWILNPLSEARDGTCILMDTNQVLNPQSHNGNSPPHSFLYLFQEQLLCMLLKTSMAIMCEFVYEYWTRENVKIHLLTEIEQPTSFFLQELWSISKNTVLLKIKNLQKWWDFSSNNKSIYTVHLALSYWKQIFFTHYLLSHNSTRREVKQVLIRFKKWFYWNSCCDSVVNEPN